MNALARLHPPRETICTPVVVAIPAIDERERVGQCLAALARQRDRSGAPLPEGSFAVLLLANNCSDDTADVARRLRGLPFELKVVEATLPAASSHAGGARKAAMDLAADLLEREGKDGGVIATTDADSRVMPTWLAEILAAVASGADAVAGWVDPDADEFLALGPRFGQRGRDEDRYLAVVAELYARCDPRSHDPWPNHRVSSGANLAVTLAAYRAVGGMPLLPLGEDAGFVRALERGGFRVRHSPDAVVATSCRFEGRAPGGAADTMRFRHADPDAPCDDGLHGARATLRVAALKGRLRRLHRIGALSIQAERWAARATLPVGTARVLATQSANAPFAVFWEALADARSPTADCETLRPADLPEQIRQGHRAIRMLRRSGGPPRRAGDRADTPPSDAGVTLADGLPSPG